MRGHPVLSLIRGSFLVQLALAVSGPLVVRLLGVEGRGEFAIIWAVVLFVSQVAPLGVPDAITWFALKRNLSPEQLLRTHRRLIAVLVVGGAVISSAGVVLTSMVSDPISDLTMITVIAGFGGATITCAVFLLAAVRGQQRYVALARLQAFPGVFYAVGVLCFFIADFPSLTWLLLLNYLGWFVVVVSGGYLVTRPAPEVSGAAAETAAPPTPPEAGEVPDRAEMQRVGMRSIGVNTAPIDNLGIDQLLVGILLGHAALGLYSIGLTFKSTVVLFLIAIGQFAGARIATMPPETQRAFARRWLLAGLGLGVAICLVWQAAIGLVLPLAFGQEAVVAETTARLFVAAGIFLGARRLAGALLLGLGQQAQSTAAELVGLTIMVAGMVLAGLTGGATTATLAMLIAGASTLSIQVYFLARATRARTPRSGVEQG